MPGAEWPECVIWFDPRSLEVTLPYPLYGLVVLCEGPSSGECRCYGYGCRYLERVEGMSWDEGDAIVRESGILVSDRWHPACGVHSRVYLVKAGGRTGILVSHDESGYEGAHLLLLKQEAEAELARLYAWLKEKRP
jgi:hypothetical protein